MAVYACKCLNIRITTTTPPDSAAPPVQTDPRYTPIFVDDDGIVVAHPQVTVRLATRPAPIPGTSRSQRFNVLSCLFCNLAPYRVAQTMTPDIGVSESVLLPTEDWVEHEILKTPTGWIEVHNECLTGDAIREAQTSPAYAAPFELLLPAPSSPIPASPKLDPGTPSPRQTPPSDEEPASYLDLRSLFLPPPYVPSHPVFALLASLATRRSQQLRAAAEQRIAAFIRAEAAGLEEQEKELKHQVQTLWKDFTTNLRTLQSERRVSTSTPARPRENGSTASPQAAPSSVMIRNFVPVPVHSPRSPPPQTTPKVSALSASLRTSGFHHPHHAKRSSSVDSDSSDSSSSHQTSSQSAGSSTLAPPSTNGAAANILQFKRSINDSINTAASFQYFVNLDEDIARYRKQKEATKAATATQANEELKEDGPLPSASDPKPDSSKKAENGAVQQADTPSAEVETKTAAPSRGRDKGKRKVTFDVEPAVVTIADDVKQNEELEVPTGPLIFDLEEGEQSSESASETTNSLPLLDQPAARPIRLPRKARSQNTARAMEAWASLRPSSLPAPSLMRPVRSSPGVDASSPSFMLSLPRSVSAQGVQRVTVGKEDATPRSEEDKAILKLVAADTPSHRGAWDREGKAWKTFTRRQDGRENGRDGHISEDDEDADEKAGPSRLAMHERLSVSLDPPVAGSLPVNIDSRLPPRRPLSLASYKPAPALPEQEEEPEPSHKSSASIRKAVYAERDRARAMDPGVLDFTAQDNEEDDDADDEDDGPLASTSVDTGERARLRAFKILQAGSSVPEESMWRSLAT